MQNRNVKYYNRENERLGRPSGSIEKEILDKVTFKDSIKENLFVGSFGWKTTQGKLGDGYLYKLDEYDQNTENRSILLRVDTYSANTYTIYLLNSSGVTVVDEYDYNQYYKVYFWPCQSQPA